jgi:hypothetical protein
MRTSLINAPQAGIRFNCMIRAAASPAWRDMALCMITVNIADSGLAFACFGRLGADYVNGGRPWARGGFSWRQARAYWGWG